MHNLLSKCSIEYWLCLLLPCSIYIPRIPLCQSLGELYSGLFRVTHFVLYVLYYCYDVNTTNNNSSNNNSIIIIITTTTTPKLVYSFCHCMKYLKNSTSPNKKLLVQGLVANGTDFFLILVSTASLC